MNKKIAIIGSGISGLTSAYILSRNNEVTLFEANDYLGGHTATVDVELHGESHSIDTGFIVFNNKTYPNFIKLLEQNNIAYQNSEMSFSVQHKQSGIEYNGRDLNTLFAQRSNLFRPQFYRFISEIVRFNKAAKEAYCAADSESGKVNITLQEFLVSHHFSDFFAQHYILPMVAAIWSSSIDEAGQFPLRLFLRFFYHHGLLNINDRPQWYVLKNGSHSYIPKLLKPVHRVLTKTAVDKIVREADKVKVYFQNFEQEFDEVILACHSDQALKLLENPSDEETQVLSKLKYQHNDVVLHTDSNFLPKNKRAWASWNFFHDNTQTSPVAVTYNMNILQGIKANETFCVTLNRTSAINPDRILGQYSYAHPVYTSSTVEAQQQREMICGKNRTHFCGAYWYNGFHEDGVKSALDICRRFGAEL